MNPANYDPETLLIAGFAAGIFAGAVIGFFAAGLLANRKIHAERRRAYAAAENLYLKRKAADLRDDAPLQAPVSRF